MAQFDLDQWGVFTPTSEMKKPMILSDAHADYLYEQSYGRQTEKMYDAQVGMKLDEERLEKEAHKEYTKKNYIKIGEC